MERVPVVVAVNDLLLAGVQRLAIDQLMHYDRAAFDMHLIVLMDFPGRESFHDMVPKDVTIHQLHFSGLRDVGEWVRLWKLLRHIQPQVVKSATFFSNTVFLLLRHYFGYAVVAAEHNTVNKKPLWQRWVDWILLPRAYTIIGDSQMVVSFVSEVEKIHPSHFTVVYNGVDLDAIHQAESDYRPQRDAVRATLGIPKDAHVFLTAARLVRQKNHQLMIDAFKLVHTQLPHAYLVIAGEGALREKLEGQISNHGLQESVRLPGALKDIHRLYAIADTFVMTSHHEGFCITAMEGLAFGMPLISTRVAGISEYLVDGENGYFAEPTAEDVAAKMVAAATLSPEARAVFHAAGKKTAAGYSTVRYGEELNRLMKGALATVQRKAPR